ncbi:MAG: hypothetical protein EAZ08_14170 [Cytophagales bacterium]|nr:MAG: hypothetical protein EAZ08_14170 [Cytophagales bacterium]
MVKVLLYVGQSYEFLFYFPPLLEGFCADNRSCGYAKFGAGAFFPCINFAACWKLLSIFYYFCDVAYSVSMPCKSNYLF